MSGPLSGVRAHGVPCAPVLERHQVFEQEQVKVNGTVLEQDHPIAGRIRQPRPAARFDRTPIELTRHAPVLGEHTREILGELGLDADDLAAAGVIPPAG